jgi:hypothetical protein
MTRPPRLPPLPDEARLVFRSAGPSGEVADARARPGEAARVSGVPRREEAEPLGSILARPLDWQLVLLLAEREKAVGRLHRVLSRDHSDRLPPQVMDHLGRLAQVESFRAMVLEQRLESLLDALEEADIPVLLLKGAAMARTIYPSFADRPMGDLDLLVLPSHAQQARSVAESKGWSVADGVPEESFPDEVHQHLPPMSDGTALNLGLDLHTRLSGTWEPRGFGPPDLWSRARTASGRRLAMVPDPVDLLIHVCTHYAWSHMLAFGSWKAFRDVAVLLESEAWDRTQALDRIRQARVENMVWWTLEMSRAFAGVPSPEWRDTLPSPAIPPWVQRPLLNHFAARAVDLEAAIPVRVTRWAWEVALRPERAGARGTRPWSNDSAFFALPPRPGDESDVRAALPSMSHSPWARVGLGVRHLRWVLTR